MGWRESLQLGSFRGVPFFWEKADSEIGRKTARHDYPLRDDCYIEDMGLQPSEFTLDVIVIGEDYMAQRDDLARAIQTPGPGTLVHPTMGTLKVAVFGKVRVSESTREGGMCRFTIPFVVAGENRYPTAKPSTQKSVMFRASQLYGEMLSDFAAAWRLVRMPSHVIESAIATVLGVADTLLRIANLTKGIVPNLDFQFELALLRESSASLLSYPDSISERIVLPILALSDSAVAPSPSSSTATAIARADSVHKIRYRAQRSLFTFGGDAVAIVARTPSMKQTVKNRTALHSLVRRAAISEAARAVSSMTFPSYQDATVIRDELVGAIDTEAEAVTTSDAAFASLTDLRAAVVADIADRGANLARIVAYTPHQTVPALVLAHRLYGDASQAEEIVTRNRVRHPLFTPGGNALEVLVP